MKIKSLLLSALAMSLALVSCTKEEPKSDSPSMTLNPESLYFEATGTLSKTVQVVSNRDWKVNGLDEWVSLSVDGKDIEGQVIPASANPVTVTVSVLENSGMERAAGIVFNGGTIAQKTLQVSQAGMTDYTTIAEIRAMNPDPSKSLAVKAEDGTTVKGYVISDRNLSNLTSKKAFHIQDETGGMYVYCTTDHNFDFGDEVVLDLSGVTLEYYMMLFEVNGITVDKINKLSSGNAIEPITVSVNDYKANKYESRYIEIEEDVQVAEGSLDKKWVVGGNHTSIDMLASNGETFVVRSSKYSTFGDETVAQGSGKIRGISTIYNDGMQLVFAQATDWAGLTNERFKIETPKIESNKVSVILEASNGAEVILNDALVVATSTTDLNSPSATFLVTDSGRKDYLVVFGYTGVSPEVGDVVKVEGVMSRYGKENRPQISGPTVTVLSSGTTVDYPEPEDITADFDNFPQQEIKYVSVTGTYILSDNGKTKYQNIIVDGSTRGCSFLTPNEIDMDPFLNQPNVKFTGYYVYSNSNYLYIMLTKVEAGEGEYMVVTPEEQEVPATATSAGITVLSNADWTCTSLTDGFTVSEASGHGDATVTVSFSENEDTQNSRTAEVKFTCGTIERTVTITQKFAVASNTVILTFPDDNSANNKVGGYDKDWVAKSGACTFNIFGFNNNNWSGWTYVRCGHKKNDVTATITTADPFAFAISKVEMDVDTYDSSKYSQYVNSTRLEISSSADFSTDVETVEIELAKGTNVFEIASPAANKYYRIVVETTGSGTNGFIQVSKISYIAQ